MVNIPSHFTITQEIVLRVYSESITHALRPWLAYTLHHGRRIDKNTIQRCKGLPNQQTSGGQAGDPEVHTL
jgi:hypothetical protein